MCVCDGVIGGGGGGGGDNFQTLCNGTSRADLDILIWGGCTMANPEI